MSNAAAFGKVKVGSFAKSKYLAQQTNFRRLCDDFKESKLLTCLIKEEAELNPYV